ncbi:MAG TPA: hypothetical protein VK553_01685, partial [Candidatus Nitrosopolaris rasttigaisensis]|nr:hypothetical protein [Candidatus Nitrosopolaris rasttigaisensis]
YCSYDWVVLCQLFGTMMELPTKWPRYCNDLKQLQKMLMPGHRFPKQYKNEHNALADALWTKEAWINLITEAQNVR